MSFIYSLQTIVKWATKDSKLPSCNNVYSFHHVIISTETCLSCLFHITITYNSEYTCEEDLRYNASSTYKEPNNWKEISTSFNKTSSQTNHQKVPGVSAAVGSLSTISFDLVLVVWKTKDHPHLRPIGKTS